MESDLRFPFRTKHSQITQGSSDFRRRKAFQGSQGFIIIGGQQGLGVFYVLAIDEVVAKLEEDAEIETKIGDLLDLFG